MDQHHVMFREGLSPGGSTPKSPSRLGLTRHSCALWFQPARNTLDYAVITAQTAYLRAHYPLEFASCSDDDGAPQHRKTWVPHQRRAA